MKLYLGPDSDSFYYFGKIFIAEADGNGFTVYCELIVIIEVFDEGIEVITLCIKITPLSCYRLCKLSAPCLCPQPLQQHLLC